MDSAASTLKIRDQITTLVVHTVQKLAADFSEDAEELDGLLLFLGSTVNFQHYIQVLEQYILLPRQYLV